ncbi:MAG: OmpH family outer membrane protein [Parvibaculum sp.]|jgi:Skp family chaperone for outer membrane proteins|uniref:OmpH family outer membrane protein n=1 Tax=Parvibaculum sp. TaxID=2024848 RepID=UPI00284ACC0B|nr:OmpH family outer membrane protein [Parvibaculum sp.]MDR3498433.1 OmpH family outer membrane protein [Parvibaculum sp.]
MKLFGSFARAFTAFAVASCLYGASYASAQAAAAPVIVIVNTEQIFAQSKVGQNVRTQLQALASKIQLDGKKGEASIQAEAKKLGEQRSLLSEADFQKKVQALEQKQAEFQQTMRRKGQELQLGSNKARADIETAIRPIFADVMKKNGANILLDQSVVLAGGVDLDVTAEVLKELDAKLTSLVVKPIPVPAGADAQSGQ